MNPQVILAAQKFSADHFCNYHLGQAQFISLIKERLVIYSIPEDKVAFLKEVIRLGKVFLNNSVKVLEHMEEQDLSKVGFKQLEY